MKSLLALIIGITIVAMATIGYLYFGKDVSAPTNADMEASIVNAGITSLTVPTTASVASSSVQTFNLTGKNFEFSLKEMRVKKGDTVRINFESMEGFHDWTIDEFAAATEQVDPGTLTSVEFVADKTGAFEYYSSFEGDEAEGMVGQLFVEE